MYRRRSLTPHTSQAHDSDRQVPPQPQPGHSHTSPHEARRPRQGPRRAVRCLGKCYVSSTFRPRQTCARDGRSAVRPRRWTAVPYLYTKRGPSRKRATAGVHTYQGRLLSPRLSPAARVATWPPDAVRRPLVSQQHIKPFDRSFRPLSRSSRARLVARDVRAADRCDIATLALAGQSVHTAARCGASTRQQEQARRVYA